MLLAPNVCWLRCRRRLVVAVEHLGFAARRCVQGTEIGSIDKYIVMRLSRTSEDGIAIVRSLRDPEVFAGVSDRHFAAVYRYIARRTGSDVAEDLAADVHARVRPQGVATAMISGLRAHGCSESRRIWCEPSIGMGSDGRRSSIGCTATCWFHRRILLPLGSNLKTD